MKTKVVAGVVVVLALAASGPVIAAASTDNNAGKLTTAVSSAPVLVAAKSGRLPAVDKLRETIKAATMFSTGHPPMSGVGYDAGRVSGRHGDGAVLQTVTFPSPKTCHPSQCKLRASFEVMYPNGAFYGRLTGYDSLNTDGSTATEGTGRILSGTGRYRGAHGTFRFQGSSPKNSYVETLKLCGSASY